MQSSAKKMSATTVWPEGFMDIGGMTFQQVYDRKKEFVDFTLTEMKKCSGMFREFQDFCKEKENRNNDASRCNQNISGTHPQDAKKE